MHITNFERSVRFLSLYECTKTKSAPFPSSSTTASSSLPYPCFLPYLFTNRAEPSRAAAEMENYQLVFIPSPGLSHLVSTVEAAKLLLLRDTRLSITVLTMQLPNDTTVENYTTKISAASTASPRITLTALPSLPDWTPKSKNFLFEYIDGQITNVREIISGLIERRGGAKLAGLVLDMFCLNFIDVAREFSLPSYVFFTSGACGLGLFQYLVSLKFEQNKDPSEFKNSDEELQVPCFSLPFPAKLLPAVFLDGGDIAQIFFNYIKRLPETKGTMVNTFYELEPYAIDSISSKTPKVYPVGPILDLSSQSNNDDVEKWLDNQPEKSVIFLCFGTMGTFVEAQVREIALALENSGCRFLWSLRKPGVKGGKKLVDEYDDFGEVLPEGFLERTRGVGKVIGWAAQKAALGHAAVGGFISHCGWNSTLESVWFGVPMATFPMYAEQQMNAFLLVEELGIAEKIRLDYCLDFKGEREPEIVGAEEIEAAIRRVMAAEGGGVREKVEEMQRKGRAALEEGGSSYKAQTLFIEDVISNINNA